MIFPQLANNKYNQRFFCKAAAMLAASSMCFLITSCASNAPKNMETPSQQYQTLDPNSPEYLQAMLIQKSSEAIEAQKTYVMLVAEQQQAKEEKQSAFDNEYIEVQNFIGKPNTLLKAIAHRYGYEYREEGFARNLPTLNLDIKNDAPIEVLKQISYQINGLADMIVDKDQKVIRLIYRQGK
jgi:hypothetical protein